jgi:hypothetical protein
MKKQETKNRKRDRPICLRVTDEVREILRSYSKQTGQSQNQIMDSLLRKHICKKKNINAT